MRDTKRYNLHSAKGATGWSVAIPCEDFRTAVIGLATSGTTTATVKIAGAVALVTTAPGAESAPTFTSAASISNPWDYIEAVNLQNGSAVDGDTGHSWAGTDTVELYEVNVNELDYIAVQVDAWTQGAITAWIVLSDNQ